MEENRTKSRRKFMMKSAFILSGLHLFLESCSNLKEFSNDQPINLFQELELYVHPKDLIRQKEFYTAKMQLPLVSENTNQFSVKAGKTILRFSINHDYKEPYYHIAFNIPENKLNKAKQWSENRFKLLLNDYGEDVIHFRKWNAHSIYFMDPCGNILEFIAHHKLKNSADGSFTEKDILYIIEIGLVTNNVNELSHDINQKLGLTDYHNSAGLLKSSKFRAVGNTAGMLILSERGRNWLMTDIPSDEFPLNIKVRSDKNGKIYLNQNKYKIEFG